MDRGNTATLRIDDEAKTSPKPKQRASSARRTDAPASSLPGNVMYVPTARKPRAKEAQPPVQVVQLVPPPTIRAEILEPTPSIETVTAEPSESAAPFRPTAQVAPEPQRKTQQPIDWHSVAARCANIYAIPLLAVIYILVSLFIAAILSICIFGDSNHDFFSFNYLKSWHGLCCLALGVFLAPAVIAAQAHNETPPPPINSTMGQSQLATVPNVQQSGIWQP